MKEFLRLCIDPKNWRKLFKEYREIIMYVFFGGLTTLVSIATYFAARNVFPNENSVPDFLGWLYRLNTGDGDSSTILPNIISWIISVTFAFVTNRIWVFKSKVKGFAKVLLQAFSFYAARLFTLFVDIAIMWLLVNLPNINNGFYELCVKIFSNIIVLVLNYIFSKLFIFRKKSESKSE